MFGALDGYLADVSEYAMELQTPPLILFSFLTSHPVLCELQTNPSHRLQLSSAVAACEVGEPNRVSLLDLHGKISGGEGAATPPARRICLPRAILPPCPTPHLAALL